MDGHRRTARSEGLSNDHLAQIPLHLRQTLQTLGRASGLSLATLRAADVVTPILPHVEPHLPRNHEGFFNHKPARQIRERVGSEIWNSYFKFCVERNPWDKALSYYHMLNVRQGGGLSLDQFLKGNDFPVNFDKYTEPGDPKKIIVDRVLRYERLMEELSEGFAGLGIPFDGSLCVNAKSEYRTDRRPYREVFTRAQAERVAEIFAVERALHGYECE